MQYLKYLYGDKHRTKFTLKKIFKKNEIVKVVKIQKANITAQYYLLSFLFSFHLFNLQTILFDSMDLELTLKRTFEEDIVVIINNCIIPKDT